MLFGNAYKRFFLWFLLIPNIAAAEISYLEILRNPDDINLNRQYALERIQAQDIKPALSAIERVIQAAPLDLGARLIRAQILISLGDHSMAQSELELLARFKLPPEEKDLVTKLLKDSKDAKKNIFLSGQLSHSFSFSDNIGGHTDSGLIADANGNTVGNFFTDSEGNISKTKDLIDTTQLKLNFIYDLGTQENDALYADFTSSNANGHRTNISDATSNQIILGALLNTPTFKNNLYIDHQIIKKKDLTVGNDIVAQDNQKNFSLGVRSNFQIEDINFQADLLRTSSDFYNRDALSDISDATTTSISINAMKPLSYTSVVYGNFNFARRRADQPNLAFASESQNRNTKGIGGGIIHMPLAGHRIILNTSFQNHSYQIHNQVSDQYIREDNELLVSAGYSLDGSTFSEEISSLKVDFLLSHSKVMSNMPTYDVTTNTFTIAISYPFSI